MALISPDPSTDHAPVDFRAPPPSPVASGRRSSVTNDDVLSNFLQHSLHVPNLTLPDKVFPRQNPIQNPPKVDFSNLDESVQEILDSISGSGCFQLVNHGIRGEVVRSVLTAGAGVFGLLPEEKKAVVRSPEKVYGFEEFRGEDEREMGEEFVWCRDEGLELEMEGVWPTGYSNFSNKMERLLLEIENIAGKIFQVLKEHTMRNPICENGTTEGQEIANSICYLYKHCPNINGDEWASSLKHDVIRMLVRGSDYSHALCLHLCDGSSEFHVYSKRGWVSFCPDKDAIVITIGDQIQAWSGGKYKHVIGRPIFKGEAEEDSCISMAFLCSPQNITNSLKTNKGKKPISLGQQVLVAILFTLVYHFWVYFT
ncbi:hypothetical protein RHSIM_Rhsim08G0227100 [Rhododendron simsii]|uniref:Uncharacterized protein n=1 Tax=Rhododendron simsii TaxID=118357 RepID=A0A834GI80_RHOSS|nr:hypothetical protein RHSIM_Rhsim08G0227100 [Rhododendron simsii]